MPTHPEDLRRELAAAAAELGPLASDARGRVGRRARWLRLRRRVVSGVVAAALVSAGVALLASRGDDRVGVVTTPGTPKEVAPAELDDPDAIVYTVRESALPGLRSVFDTSEAVESFAVIDEPCGGAVAGVDLAEPEGDSVNRLRSVLPRDLSVLSLSRAARASERALDADLSVRMLVEATPEQTAWVEQMLRDSPSVVDLRVSSNEDALVEFRRQAAGDPVIADVGVDDLPVSFHVSLADGVEPAAFVEQIGHPPGVDEVVVGDPVLATHPSAHWQAAVAVSRRPKILHELEVFMTVDASPEQMASAEQVLRESPRVTDLSFVSKEEAFEEFQRTFADEPELVSAVTAADLPASWRVQVAEPNRENADAIRALVAGMPGVDTVVDACSPFRSP